MSTKPIAVVTGGAGFIGSHMVDVLLGEGFHVNVIDNLAGGHKKNLAHVIDGGDVTCFWDDIRTLPVDHPAFTDARYVFHFAGIGDIVPSMEHPVEYMDVNVQGTVRVLECARANAVKKFVYAASSSCYGLADVPTPETAPKQPQYPYALSKYLGEQSVFHWHQVYGLPCNAVRIFNAYGPRVRTTGAYGAVFGVFFKQKLAGKPFTVVGDGSQTRDFIYVTDIARAFWAAAQTEISGESWNAGAGNPQSVNRLAELLQGDITYIPKRPGEPDSTHADISKITHDLDWHPQIPFEQGVSMMLKHIDDWTDAPLWDEDSIKKATKSWFQFLGSPDAR